MGLVKRICPKCGQALTIDESLKVKVCPVCGAKLDDKNDDEEKGIESPSLSYDEYINKGLDALKNNDITLISSFIEPMKEQYGSFFFTALFALIIETKIDFIYHLPEIYESLSEEEVDEDMRSRYYHLARRKYFKVPQKTYNKIAGKYADIPGESRGKWNRSITSYTKKEAEIKKYSKIAELIRDKYLSSLEEKMYSQLDKDIVFNIKIWLDKVSHASIDFYSYNLKADEVVKKDYNDTPNPGNKTKFFSYLLVYLVSLAGLIFNTVEMIIEGVSGSAFHGPLAYIFAAISTTIYVFAVAIAIASGRLLSRFPLFAVSLIILSALICTGGIVTADLAGSVWFNITSIVISLTSVIITTYKMVYYYPHRQNTNTIIGNFQALVDDSFVVDFKYDWSKYSGGSYTNIK